MTAVTVTTTPQSISASWVELQNLGTADVWMGVDNTVSASNGVKLASGASYSRADVSAYWKLWVVTSAGTADLRILPYGSA